MRDTQRIEALLAATQASRQLVRDEIAAGASLQQIHDDLLVHEQTFSARLKELQEFNRRKVFSAEKSQLRLVAPRVPASKRPSPSSDAGK